jgi:hypothetical protein
MTGALTTTAARQRFAALAQRAEAEVAANPGRDALKAAATAGRANQT